MTYRPELDGLRAIAVLAVLLFHAGFSLFAGGYVGVDIFFVLSGYLITSILLEEMAGGRFSMGAFYERRVRRLLPAQFVVLAASLPMAWFWLLPADYKEFSLSLVAVPLMAANALFMNLQDYFATEAELIPLLHLWTLSLEEQFYVALPVLLLAMSARGLRATFALLAVLAMGSFAAAEWALRHDPGAAFFMLHTRAWELALGSLLALGGRLWPGRLACMPPALTELLSAFGLAMMLGSIGAFDADTRFPGLLALIPTVGAALVIACARTGTRVARLLASRPLVAVGLVSYSVYLWHQPVFAFARHRMLDPLGPLHALGLCMLTLVLAGLSWRYVEQPLRQSQGWSRRQIFAMALGGSAVFVAAGFAGFLSDGLPTRFSRDVQMMAAPQSGNHPACAELEVRAEGVTCRLGDPGSSPTIALVGDSHAARLTGELHATLLVESRSAVAYLQSWCTPLLDVATEHAGRRPICRAYVRRAFEDIASNKDIHTVILAAQWANATDGKRATSREVAWYRDAQSRESSVAENRAVVHRGMVRTRDWFLAHARQAVWVTSVPEYAHSVPRTLARRALWTAGPSLPPREMVNPAAYAQRNGPVQDALGSSGLGAMACVVDSFAALCPTGTCEVMDGGEPLYTDGHHLSRAGARRLMSPLHRCLSHP